MKKTILSLGLMLVSALALTNCTKNEEVVTPQVSVPFELFAGIDTRTTNDGMSTEWAANDNISVFNAATGTTTYSANNEFKTVAGDGNFTGTLKAALTEQAYDWYVIYPYSSYLKSPANTADGYSYIGSRSDGVQTQNGNNSMAHIAGKNYPLVGWAEKVPATEKPQITMQHVSSLIEFNVTNNTDDEFKVESIVFTAPVNINGTFYINHSTTNVIFTDAQHISKSATLTVSNGAAIANGQSAKFYMGVKPFDADEDTLTINITTDKGTFEKSIDASTFFYAGKMKTINVKVDELEEIVLPENPTSATLSFANVNNRTSLSTSEQVWEENGITLINKKNKSTNNVADYSNPARFYKGSSVTILSSAYNFTGFTFNCNSAEYATAMKNSIGSDATVSGTAVSVTLNTPANTFEIAEMTAQVRINSLTAFISSEGGEIEAQIIVASPNIEIASDQTSTTTGVTLIGITEQLSIDWSAEWITNVTFEDSVLSITTTANTATAPREATITISANNIEQTINIKQKGFVDENKLEELTVAEFLSKEVSTDVWYKLTGTISNITNTSYGNFDLTDETGTIYVYGLTAKKVTSNDKSFASLGLKAGDIVTLIGQRAVYNGSAQVGGPAYFESKITATATPTISYENGKVTISCTDSDAVIYYTLDGTTPTTASTVYSAPFAITENVTVKAFAVAEGKAASSVVTESISTTAVSYVLLTDASKLAVGDKIVIAAKDSSVAMSSQNGNYRNQATITKSGSTITFGNDVQVLTLEAGTKSGTFAFNTGSGYLAAVSSSSNNLKTNTTKDANSSWLITLGTNGAATIKAQGDYTKNVILYNQTSTRFSCYGSLSSATKEVVIYRAE